MATLLLKLKINPFFWVVLSVGVVTGYFREVIMLFLIVFIHEMGHVVAAHYFKWRIHKIELLPFGGVAEVEDIGNRPFKEELIVILAGPIQHVWLIGLSYSCLSLSFWSNYDHTVFVSHNIVILIFNFIPVLPLDGGRLVQLWLTYRYAYVHALQIAHFVSIVIIILLIVSSIILLPFHLNLWIVLLFLFISNYLEWKQRHYTFLRFLMGRRSRDVKHLYTSTFVVSSSLSLRDALKKCRRGHNHYFVIQHKNGSTFIDEEKLLRAFFIKKLPLSPLSTIITT